ncbi:MAG TPA: YihY/virulence factor BrkB family protein [Blastocatellia bacterium]|nr:YihY/virulence factor BrkB family protein [Blastocatellia bacterium]
MQEKMLGGLSIKELAARTWREANEDNIFGRAAELAYYFLLALFPMLIFLTSLVGFLPGAQEGILDAVAKAAPSDAMTLVRETLNDVVSNRSGGLISFGILGTIWAASSGTAAVMEALNDAYEAEEGRGFIKVRLLAIGMTVALALLIVGGTALIMFGDRFAHWIAVASGLGPTFETVWHYVDYVLGLALISLGLQVIYYFGPNLKQDWEWVTPGAIVAVVALIIVSLLFSLYLRFAPSYSATYGSLGAVIILMLYLYLIGLVVLVGAEINSEIRKANHIPTVEKEPSNDLKAA